MIQKLVLTGGPSGGKTTMAMAINRAFARRVQVVPEAASLLFSGGFRRVNHDAGVRQQQMAIYHVQSSHEAIFELDFPSSILVCDRGTLDGLAYWPGSESEFFTAIGSSRAEELKRYTWVIHLDTAQPEDYNTNNNPHRTEDIHRANEINQKVQQAWTGHPQRFIIPNQRRFVLKMGMTLEIVDLLLQGKSHGEICLQVGCSN